LVGEGDEKQTKNDCAAGGLILFAGVVNRTTRMAKPVSLFDDLNDEEEDKRIRSKAAAKPISLFEEEPEEEVAPLATNKPKKVVHQAPPLFSPSKIDAPSKANSQKSSDVVPQQSLKHPSLFDDDDDEEEGKVNKVASKDVKVPSLFDEDESSTKTKAAAKSETKEITSQAKNAPKKPPRYCVNFYFPPHPLMLSFNI
jgi:hypothetical protein